MNGFISKPLKVDEIATRFTRIMEAVSKETDAGGCRLNGNLCTIHQDKLDQVKHDLADKFEPLVRMFLDHMPELLETIRTAILENNLPELKSTAHKLRGNSAGFYAQKMADLCGQVEQSAVEGNLPSGDLIRRLESEAKNVKTALLSEIQEG